VLVRIYESTQAVLQSPNRWEKIGKNKKLLSFMLLPTSLQHQDPPVLLSKKPAPGQLFLSFQLKQALASIDRHMSVRSFILAHSLISRESRYIKCPDAGRDAKSTPMGKMPRNAARWTKGVKKGFPEHFSQARHHTLR